MARRVVDHDLTMQYIGLTANALRAGRGGGLLARARPDRGALRLPRRARSDGPRRRRRRRRPRHRRARRTGRLAHVALRPRQRRAAPMAVHPRRRLRTAPLPRRQHARRGPPRRPGSGRPSRPLQAGVAPCSSASSRMRRASSTSRLVTPPTSCEVSSNSMRPHPRRTSGWWFAHPPRSRPRRAGARRSRSPPSERPDEVVLACRNAVPSSSYAVSGPARGCCADRPCAHPPADPDDHAMVSASARVAQDPADVGEEARALLAVDEPVVERQRTAS